MGAWMDLNIKYSMYEWMDDAWMDDFKYKPMDGCKYNKMINRWMD